MKLHLESNIAEGTPEELVEYLRLVEGNSSDNQLFSFGHAHQPDGETLKSLVGSLVKGADSYTEPTEIPTEEEAEEPSKEFQVGDKVKVLESAWGAEGVYTVTKVLEDGMVLVEGKNRNGIYLTNWSSHASNLEKVEEEPSTGLQVGDKVRVLKSACGAVGEATVTAVHENGEVEIAGTSREGIYLSNWSSHVTLLEKIEEEEDKLMGYTFWYLDTANFNTFVVLKASLEGYFEDSTGKRYTYQAVSGYAKPVTTESVREVFEEAEREGSLLKYFPTIDMFDKA